MLKTTFRASKSRAVPPIDVHDGNRPSDGPATASGLGARRIATVGSRFGRWTVIRDKGPDNRNRKLLVCVCDCGVTRGVLVGNLVGNLSRSCGCISREAAVARAVHGHARGRKYTPEYRCWRGMTQRCFYPNQSHYPNYGGRGITVCERWRKFENFLVDMGPKPSSKHSIDRIDNDGNYEPGNCRWATGRQQSLNRRQRKSETGVVGVYRSQSGSRFFATCKINGKQFHLGRFDTIEAAVLARRAAISRLEEQVAL